jgi:hypothetical protein
MKICQASYRAVIIMAYRGEFIVAENINEKYVTAAQLKEFGWKNITPEKVTDLSNTLEKFSINTPTRIQQFLSQCAQETGKGRSLTEQGGKQFEGSNNKAVNPEFDQIHSTTIGQIRTALNVRIDEASILQKELKREINWLKGNPLTKEQAEKKAASDYVNGENKLIDQQAKELQIKRDKLSHDEKKMIAYGKEHGLDKTIWKMVPEFLKGEGLKYYESSMAAIEHSKQVFGRQAGEIQAKREQLEARLQTPEARLEIESKVHQYLQKDEERLAKLQQVEDKSNELYKEKVNIIVLKNAIPARNLETVINLQGDPQNTQNLLGQSDTIKQQVAEVQQVMARTSRRSL